ncbi:MAG: chromate transporter [Betaproteobacteria bacterium]|nr:chromate transporter [Betaproteobacteria bacterium]
MFLDLFIHFLMLSLLATGGAITLAPEMHRYMVTETGLLTDVNFTASLAIAQSAPGPNILFVTVLGWQAMGPMGALATTVGIMTPSAALTLVVNRVAHHHGDTLWMRALRQGLAPVVIALMLATAWILSEQWWGELSVLAVVLVSAVLVAVTRVPPLVMILLGALIGGFGLLG